MRDDDADPTGASSTTSRSHGSGDQSRPELDRPVPADWLASRRDADTRAREAASPLLERLGEALASPSATVLDLGSGTGANQAYLDPRLPFDAEWVLLDHDPALLDFPGQGAGRRVLAGVEELEALLRETPPPRMVTCSALLDLLSADQLDALADTLTRTRTPALLSLTVTGEVSLTPAHPDDAVIARAFDAHQARESRPGPGAAGYLTERLEQGSAVVLSASTPWGLTAESDPDLLRRWLTERAEVAVEQEPDLADRARAWAASRLAELDAGVLVAQVGHTDLLVIPRG